MSTRPLLVVGVGNLDRGDDGIGPAVVEAVRADPRLADVETMVAGGDLSDLVVTWCPGDDVVVVDAMASGRAPGTIVLFDALRHHLPVGYRPLSSHGFGLADTIELARRLDRLPRTLTVVAVELGDTGHLGPLTGVVAGAVGDVVSMITTLARQRRRLAGERVAAVEERTNDSEHRSLMGAE